MLRSATIGNFPHRVLELRLVETSISACQLVAPRSDPVEKFTEMKVPFVSAWTFV